MSDQSGTAREALRALLDEVFDDIEHVVNGNAGYIDRDMLDRYRSDAGDYLALPHWTQRLGPVVACEHAELLGGKPLTASSEVRCAGVDDDPEDDEAGAFDCKEPSRFVVWRSDFDTSYGINGGSEEACAAHLADAVAGMVDGDVSVRAVVAVRWDAPSEEPERCAFHGGEGDQRPSCPECEAEDERRRERGEFLPADPEWSDRA